MDWLKWGMEAKVVLNGLVQIGQGQLMAVLCGAVLSGKQTGVLHPFLSICWTVFDYLITFSPVQANYISKVFRVIAD